MVVNGKSLLRLKPIVDMLNHKVKYKGVSHGLAEVGYDIRIRQDVTFTRHKWWFWKRIVIVDGVVSPGRFTLASTIEVFDIPFVLTGIVHDKSTWARESLSVFNTVLEPGWRGGLTMELAYKGHGTLHIPAGCGIAQVLFHQLAEPAEYTGKYQDQSTDPVAAIHEK